MTFLHSHLPQITAGLIAAILLGVGRKPLLGATKSSPVLMCIAFGLTVVAGFVLGYALIGVVLWLTHLGGILGGVIGSVGALIAYTMGWHGVYLLIALIRDVADGTPDEDARKAALWVPTMLPAGGSAVWGVVTHPSGIGTGLVAAIMAAITIAYAQMIVNAVLKASNGRTAWLWFASLVCLLAGLVTIPLVLYADGLLAAHVPSDVLVAIRVVGGILGIALIFPAIKDLVKDKKPDVWVRLFLRFGVPLFVAFSTVAIAAASGYAANGVQILNGSMR